jgi:hypothetical protein
MSKNIQESIIKELLAFIEPVNDIALDDHSIIEYFRSLGWDIEKIFHNGFSNLTSSINNINDVIEEVTILIETPPESIPDFIQIIKETAEAVESLIALGNSINQIVTSSSNTHLSGVAYSDLESLPAEIIEDLTLTYLKNRVPRVFYFLQLLGIIRVREVAGILNTSNEIVKHEISLRKFAFDKIPDLFSDPALYFNEIYGLDFTDEESLANTSQLFIHNLAHFLKWFYIHPIMGVEYADDPAIVGALEKNKVKAGIILSSGFDFEASSTTTGSVDFGALFRLLSQQEAGPGLLIEPFGDLDITTILGNWQLGLQATASVGAITITGAGFNLTLPPGGGSLTDLRIALELIKLGELEPGNQALLIGSTTGTRFEIKEIAFGGFFEIPDVNDVDIEFGLHLKLGEAAFVIQGGDGDGFLSKILPDEGLRLAFDIGLEYTNKKGFKFTFGISSGTALELVLPLNITLFNVIDFKDVRFRLAGEEGNKGMAVAIGGSVGVSIGPFKAMIENMGVKAIFNLPESGGGNLGPLDLDFGFKPPSGIAMSIDAGGFKGGGFLSIDDPRYVGALQLTFASGFNISAICIITTKLPGGEEGYSLLVVITVEFSPAIQVGMGIAITGFGGMLALHRSINTDAVRKGLKNGMLESILFPQDILGNPEKIISDLESAFPIEKDHFVFGPMIKATWGDKSFVNISFGLMIELPDPRIMLPGIISISLFDESEGDSGDSETIKVLNINIAFVGIIDIPGKMISIDASIYNSKILTMVIEGDMAFRLTWGDNPIFVLSFGGFHPAFTPPPLGLDDMNRLSIIILNEESVKLYAESYIAITSNTFQFGAAIVFYVQLGPIELDCFFGLDTIFFFNPFSMEVGIQMRGQILFGGEPVLSLTASANLSGPSPWHIYGKVSINIAEIISFEGEFDEYFGDNIPPTTPTIELRGMLRDTLLDQKNWKPLTGIGQHDLVTLGKGPEDVLLIRPMGSLSITQNLMPLEFKIEKYGSDGISGQDRFEIESVNINGINFEVTDVEDFFAPMEFQIIHVNLAAVEAESYEKYKSGIEISKSLKSGAKVNKVQGRELILIDRMVEEREAVEPNTTTNTDNALLRTAESTTASMDLGAVYDSPIARQMELKGNPSSRSDLSVKTPKAKAIARKSIRVNQQKYRVVNSLDLNRVDDNTYGYAIAKEKVKELTAADPALNNILKIVPVDKVSTDNTSSTAVTEGELTFF